MLGICIVFGAALFVSVLLPRNAGLAGLALTSALNLTGQPLLACVVHSKVCNVVTCVATVSPWFALVHQLYFIISCSSVHVQDLLLVENFL